MFAIVAAVLFGLALLLELIDERFGVITVETLVLAGLLCLALHLMPRRGRWWRR
ncbi:MAG TPA: hypothetical protein VKY81_11655 [Natronosporangium sp.]|nr:hypothetical protein [Natronosporangium sp.]